MKCLTASQPFRLLNLPPELWLKIDKMAVDDCTAVNYGDILLWRYLRGGEMVTSKAPLLVTCHTLRKELLPYYLQTKVSVEEDIRDSTRDNVGHWARSLTSSTRLKMTGVKVVARCRPDLLAYFEELLSECWKLKVTLLCLRRTI